MTIPAAKRATSAAARAALAVLLAASVADGLVSVFRIRRLKAEIRELRRPAQFDEIGNVLRMSGIDLQSHPFRPGMLPGTKRRVVAFALTGATLPAEIALWGQVRKLAPADTAFLGICADRACATAVRRLPANFPILVAGEESGFAALLLASRSGSFLVTDNRAQILAEPHLGGRGPGGVLAEIEGTK